jgi:hypothetical protein
MELILNSRIYIYHLSPFFTIARFKPTTRAPAMAPLPFGKRIAAILRQPSNDFLFFCRQI